MWILGTRVGVGYKLLSRERRHVSNQLSFLPSTSQVRESIAKTLGINLTQVVIKSGKFCATFAGLVGSSRAPSLRPLGTRPLGTRPAPTFRSHSLERVQQSVQVHLPLQHTV